MPAAAVASFTPAITGMSGTWVGALGEMAVDMGASGFDTPCVVPANAGTHNHRCPLLRRQLPPYQNAQPRRMGPRFRGDDAQSYFFAGAILASAGAAASGF